MTYETDQWPFVPAKYVGERRTLPVRRIVIHTMQAPERVDTAENVAKYFQNPDYPSSVQVCVDSDSVVQCVKDSFVAYGAKGANHDSVHIELAGYSEQTADQWRDPYSLALISMGADVAAQYCLKYSIPAIHLSLAEVAAGTPGIMGHWDVSKAFTIPGGHTDPGPNFPWRRFIAIVSALKEERQVLA